MKKVIVLISVLMCLCFSGLTVSADVMDPKIPSSDEAVTTTDPNVMAPATPDVTTAAEDDADTVDADTDEELKQKQRDRALNTGVTIMDSAMYILGIIAIVIPMLITAFYLCARVNPPVFARIFTIITLGKINYEEITVAQMLLRTVPVMVIGFFLGTGQFREYLSRFWYVILDKLGIS